MSKELTQDQLVYLSDNMYLPINYKGNVVEKPAYKGEGNHSVKELEEICKQFEEYTHQQQIIKQNCQQIIVDLKFNH